jgi:hypothetical protein
MCSQCCRPNFDRDIFDEKWRPSREIGSPKSASQFLSAYGAPEMISTENLDSKARVPLKRRASRFNVFEERSWIFVN